MKHGPKSKEGIGIKNWGVGNLSSKKPSRLGSIKLYELMDSPLKNGRRITFPEISQTRCFYD